MKEKGMFEEQKTFGVIGATVLDNFGLKNGEYDRGVDLKRIRMIGICLRSAWIR